MALYQHRRVSLASSSLPVFSLTPLDALLRLPSLLRNSFFFSFLKFLRENATHTNTDMHQIPLLLIEKCSDYFVVLIPANTCIQGLSTPDDLFQLTLRWDSNSWSQVETTAELTNLQRAFLNSFFVVSVPIVGSIIGLSLAFLRVLLLCALPVEVNK